MRRVFIQNGDVSALKMGISLMGSNMKRHKDRIWGTWGLTELMNTDHFLNEPSSSGQKPKLVGGFSPPLRKIWVSWDDDIPNWMESHKIHVPKHQAENVGFSQINLADLALQHTQCHSAIQSYLNYLGKSAFQAILDSSVTQQCKGIEVIDLRSN